MKSLTMGDYYIWYCEWCDSRNLTTWTRTSEGKVCCGGCHKEYPLSATQREEGSRVAGAGAWAVDSRR